MKKIDKNSFANRFHAVSQKCVQYVLYLVQRKLPALTGQFLDRKLHFCEELNIPLADLESFLHSVGQNYRSLGFLYVTLYSESRTVATSRLYYEISAGSLPGALLMRLRREYLRKHCHHHARRLLFFYFLNQDGHGPDTIGFDHCDVEPLHQRFPVLTGRLDCTQRRQPRIIQGMKLQSAWSFFRSKISISASEDAHRARRMIVIPCRAASASMETILPPPYRIRAKIHCMYLVMSLDAGSLYDSKDGTLCDFVPGEEKHLDCSLLAPVQVLTDQQHFRGFYPIWASHMPVQPLSFLQKRSRCYAANMRISQSGLRLTIGDASRRWITGMQFHPLRGITRRDPFPEPLRDGFCLLHNNSNDLNPIWSRWKVYTPVNRIYLCQMESLSKTNFFDFLKHEMGPGLRPVSSMAYLASYVDSVPEQSQIVDLNDCQYRPITASPEPLVV